MRKTIFCLVLISIFLIANTAVAKLATARITANEGQTTEQQEKDTLECEALAIEETGVNPAAVEMNIKMQESMLSRAAMPPARGGLTLPPSKASEVREYRNKIKELESDYKTYLQAFSEAMEARGYTVKIK